MRVLGIDPGSRVTGWGLLEGSPSRPRLVECGVIRLAAGASLAERLAALQGELEPLLARLSPGASAVESPFHGANARAALQLAHARGVVLAGLSAGGVAVVEYTPATVKKAVTGNGRATKEQVRRMVRRLLGHALPQASLDATDALAVALCHASSSGFSHAVAQALRRQADAGHDRGTAVVRARRFRP